MRRSNAFGASLTGPVYVDRRRTSSRRFGLLRRLCWAVVPILSIGLLAWVPFLRRAWLVRQRRAWIVAAVYLALAIAEFTLAGLSGGGPNALGKVTGYLGLLLMGGGAIHAWIALRMPSAYRTLPQSRFQTAEVAELARQHRIDAQHIVDHNAALARDLRIGRPDLERVYDDGGLVDVNHVPAEQLVSMLNWTAAEAADVIATRDALGGFSSTAQLMASTTIDSERVKAVAHLMVFCGT